MKTIEILIAILMVSSIMFSSLVILFLYKLNSSISLDKSDFMLCPKCKGDKGNPIKGPTNCMFCYGTGMVKKHD